MIALTLAVPAILAGVARRHGPRADAFIRKGLAALLVGTWIAWYALFIARGWLGPATNFR
ncbi:MAG: hypothetical protein WDM81_11400 [Rhizomicrobium sp.]